MKGLNQIKDALAAFAKKAKFKDGGRALSTKVKSVSAGQLAKIAGAAELANLFDSAVDKAPLLTNIYKWWTQTVDALYSNTVYKIPKIGEFIRFMSDKLGELVIPNAQKNIYERRDNMNKKVTNSPKFYENLDLHKTFSIPGGYTKTTAVNGTLGTPKIAVHRLVETPVPDKSAIVDRLNQKFSLIKAVRGLSATAYNVIDLFNYERLAKITILQYYVVKKVIQAAKTYSLAQVAIGNNIIASLGFDPTEVRNNLANYETLLCQMHRFIANNLPVSGTWIQRLEYLVEANIPDYSDPKVATIHMFAVSMNSVYYDPANPQNEFVFDCIPGAANNSYSVILSNFNSYQQAIVNYDKWQQLIADYFGAFGSKAMWQDSDYPAYAKPLDLRNADNDLSREQIKNAFYANSKVSVITINAGVPNAKTIIDIDDPTPVQLPNYVFGATFDATAEAGVAGLTYSNILNYDCYMKLRGTKGVAGLSTENFFLIPDMNGIGAQAQKIQRPDEGTYSTYISMNNHETIYSLHKDAYSEGEALEISQFKCRSIGLKHTEYASADTVEFEVFFKAHEYIMMDTTIYVFGVPETGGTTYADRTFKLCNESFSDDDLQDTESAWDYPSEIMCWALVDWMPLMHFTMFAYKNADIMYYPQDVALIDMDSFGSLDDRAFATSINYSVYSLQAAGLTIGNKRIDNLGNVYKDKASKRG